MKMILPVIIISQFLCTSLWFAGNAVMAGLSADFGIDAQNMGNLTSAVQFGFITGTLLFAIFTIADRYSPSKVFMLCALAGAAVNLSATWPGNTLTTLLFFRFATGFFLAGIYPVGMKIAADYFQKGLGKSLGFLVGALVLGTALPHLLKVLTDGLSWKAVLLSTSSLATLGGLAIYTFVPDGPYRKASKQFELSTIFKVFNNKSFRSAALGYFGHMWELYAFWAFVPFLLAYYSQVNNLNINVSLYSFIIIGIGSIGCIAGGYLSEKFSTKYIAAIALATSGLCCLLSPLVINGASLTVMIVFLLLWGVAVITDSPLFSTLVANTTTAETKGTALTIVNCVGFFITIGSIQLLHYLSTVIDPSYIYLSLAIGPIVGLTALFRR